MQTDPIGYEDGMNWYAYVGNDPVNGKDPTGEWVNYIVGVIASVAIEVTIQLATDGKVGDWNAVGVAAGTALVSGGLSAINKAGKLSKLLTESVDSGVGVAADTLILGKDLDDSLAGAAGSKTGGKLSSGASKGIGVPGKSLQTGPNTKKSNSQIKKQNKRTEAAVQDNIYEPLGSALGGKAGSEGATETCKVTGKC